MVEITRWLIISPESACALFAVSIMALGLLLMAMVESVCFMVLFTRYLLQLDAKAINCND